VGVLGLIERDDTHREVVGTAARQLASNIPVLAPRLLAMIRTACPSSARLVPEDEQLESVRLGLTYGLATIPEPGPERHELAQAARTGRRRAAQGVPLDELVKAYHLSVQVVWDELVRTVREESPGRLDLLMRSSMHVWAGIERQADAAAEAYRQARAEQRRFQDERARLLLGSLLEADEPDPVLVDAVRDALEAKFGGAESARLTWRPLNTVAPSEDAAASLLKLLDVLEDNDDVQVVEGVDQHRAGPLGLGPGGGQRPRDVDPAVERLGQQQRHQRRPAVPGGL